VHYEVEGTYQDRPALLFIVPGTVGGYPQDLVDQVREQMYSGTWVIPHPQPEASHPLDPQDPDDVLMHVRNIADLRITSIDPPPPVAPKDPPLPRGTVH
jgi:hypothetical protein